MKPSVLLVSSEMMPAAQELLSRRGYLVHQSADARLQHMTLRHPNHAPDVLIEVHRHIISSPYYRYYRRAIPEEWLWQDSLGLAIEGVPVHTLPPEATIIHRCLHFLDHTGTKGTPLRLCDIAELVRKPNVDRDGVASTLNRYKTMLPVRSVMLACQALLGLPTLAHSLQKILAL